MKYLLLSIPLIAVSTAFSQENNYIHYTTKDGLAGSTVYRICQDTKGYLWFATDNGISKFDGATFTNFTTEDGLTDNEVLFIRSDSKGRVWIMPFNKTICYYYNGKIHNPDNDSLIGKISFNSTVVMAGESRNGEIYFLTSDAVYSFRDGAPIKKIADFTRLAEKHGLRAIDFIPACLTDQFPYTMVLYNHHEVFINQNDSFVHYKTIQSNASLNRHFLRIGNDLEMIYPKMEGLQNFNSVSRINNEQSMYCTPMGAYLCDNAGNITPKPFLPGKKISHSVSDTEGNTWFSTLGEGVYRMTSQTMKTYVPGREVFCIEEVNQIIYCGLSDGSMPAISSKGLVKEYPFEMLVEEPKSRRLYCMKKDASGALFKGYDSHLSRTDKGGTVISPVRPVKSIDVIDNNHIVVCTNLLTLKLRSHDLQTVDTIWKDRGTKVIYDNGVFFIGTLDGLVTINKDGSVDRSSVRIPLLKKRIVDIGKSSDGDLWIATSDNGVLLYRNKQIVSIINSRSGLNSNICKSLYLSGNCLWVGTNKGINKIDTRDKKVLASYDISDGLASDNINAIYYKDGFVWVGSPAGLTFFKENDLTNGSVCELDLHDVVVSGESVRFSNNFHLSYKKNNISFKFNSISFKSGGEIIYRYRMKGLDDGWRETRINQLSYPTLPPGEYELNLFAINKFGKQSDTAVVKFSIGAPYWKTTWFWLIITALSVVGAAIFLQSRYQRLKRRLKEKNALLRRLSEMEQASLRSQMNPHFVFNCLNSLQTFILQNDFERTNRYLAQFAKLIRQTLDYTSKTNVSLSDEISYLNSYLELEQMRFPDAFQYNFSIDPGIQQELHFIPSMILQPFVENAVRHGVRNLRTRQGRVDINVAMVERKLVFIIEDNGVGRAKSQALKSSQHMEYQSKGITLTNDRIGIINSINKEQIKFEIIDLLDTDGNPGGTRVVFYFPFNVSEKYSV